jgi:hypothetical protein
VLKQQAMPVPAVIVPVCTMGMAREGTCRLEQKLPKREGGQRCMRESERGACACTCACVRVWVCACVRAWSVCVVMGGEGGGVTCSPKII